MTKVQTNKRGNQCTNKRKARSFERQLNSMCWLAGLMLLRLRLESQ